jgi:serine/threonine-protein kinase
VKFCPVCAREFPDNVKFCPNDGQTLKSRSASADLVGQVVADRYHILKKLGEGGMGAVYLGEHVKMGRKSAIKVMAASMSQDPDAISRFNREAANASRISHPNVCQIYDFGETPDGLIYLAMEYIEGQALKDVIEKEGALPPTRAAQILRQSADALQAAHDLGIVHRDIKPDNIMVVQGKDGTDIAKVVDFGIARAVGGDEPGQKVTKTGLVVGTPEYMSPEQLSGDKLDGRTDIYSLAMVLYRMLTGTLPFQADSAQELMIKRLTDEPVPLEVSRPDLQFPPKLQLVMNTALARDPNERYQSAAEFGRDTADAVAGLKPPQTRVDVEKHEGATQLMSHAEVALATRHQPAASVAAHPAAPARKLPLVPILGGVGAVGVLAVAGWLVMAGGGKPSGSPAQAAADTSARSTAPAGQGDQAKAPATQQQTVQNTKRPMGGTPGQAGPPPVTPNTASQAVVAPNWQDTLDVGNNLLDRGDSLPARARFNAVYNASQATNAQRGEAAFNVAATYGGRQDDVVRWLRRSNDLGFAQARETLRSLGVTP